MPSKTIPASATAGGRPSAKPPTTRAAIRATPAPTSREPTLFRRLTRSLTARLAVLAIVFAAVPLIIYNVFSAADAEKQSILVETVRDKGLVIAAALQPTLAKNDGVPFEQLSDELARYGTANTSIRLLFQPSGGNGFYYVAAAPAVSVDQLNAERGRLAEIGVLDKLAQTCSGNLPLAVRVAGPGGVDELITSITPVQSPAGCGAVVISNTVRGINGVAIGEPYWKTSEVRVALIIYGVMAALVFAMFLSLWGSLTQFGKLARGIESADAGDSFAARNRIPELAQVAADFDSMVETLKASADSIRRAAEDNAHAFKSPLGVIRQALEPLRRRVSPRGRARRDRAAGAGRLGQQARGAGAVGAPARRGDRRPARSVELSGRRVGIDAPADPGLSRDAGRGTPTGWSARSRMGSR